MKESKSYIGIFILVFIVICTVCVIFHVPYIFDDKYEIPVRFVLFGIAIIFTRIISKIIKISLTKAKK